MENKKVEIDAITGKEEYIAEILTDEQVSEMEKQQLISQASHRIQEIKAELQGMDYKTSKHADGEYTEEEWLAIVEVRKALRAEIKVLEAQLGV